MNSDTFSPTRDPARGSSRDHTFGAAPGRPDLPSKGFRLVEVDPRDLQAIQELYDQGLYLQAFTAAQKHGLLSLWRGKDARLLAGRLAYHLGSPRLAHVLHYRAWREEPGDPQAVYFYTRIAFERWGPLRAWEMLRRSGELPEAPAGIRADWFALHALVLSAFRDFSAAEEWLERAERTAPGNVWVLIERANLCELSDSYEEALAAGRQALERRPWFRAAVQVAAHALELLGRDGEALELLEEAVQRLESSHVAAQLALLQSALGDYPAALRSFERYAELTPLRDKKVSQWHAAWRSNVAYYCGDLGQAKAWAGQVGTPLFREFEKQLEEERPDCRRVHLPVKFIRQHHKTCVPATLAMISSYWAMPADHLSVAEEICYDGTPAHSERKWAEQHGWATREFTVTWECARALLDRGIPFTLTTAELGNAHMQAVIGYDSRRETLIVQDPFDRHFLEFLAEEQLKRNRATGPRGLALVPLEKGALLEGLELPEARLYDRSHRLQLCLQDHDRDSACGELQALEAEAPGHRLTLQAKRALASYDQDPVQVLACIDKLLELYPSDGNLMLTKTACLGKLARRADRLDLLKKLVGQEKADPIFGAQYAQELSSDARSHPEAVQLLRQAIRARPQDPGNLYILANILWQQRRFEEALPFYRFASCLNDKDENLVRTYFSAACHFKQTEEVLGLLKGRCRRFGKRSTQPARTLFWAYSQLERSGDAFQALEAALDQHPDDGELLLFGAEEHCRHGNLERAAVLLSGAREKSHHGAWLRTAARLATCRGDLQEGLSLWRQVLAAEPLAIDAIQAVTRLLAGTGSRAAALDQLRQHAAKFPHCYSIHQLLIEWLREEGPQAVEPVLRHLIAIDSGDAWARREMALTLGSQGRLDEALAEAETARQLEPASPSYFCTWGQLCTWRGRVEEAQQAYRQAIRLSVDTSFAIMALMALCNSKAERREALALVKGELTRQTVFGEGLLAFRYYARDTLEPEELLASLREGLEARPDLWHAWSAVICQLAEMGRLDESLDLARQATARFPLLPRLWVDFASVHRARKNLPGEVEALEQALRLCPAWGLAAGELARVYERTGDFGKARAVLEQALSRDPLDHQNHVFLARILWQLGEKEAGLARLKHAILIEPEDQGAWENLNFCCKELKRPEVAVDMARDLTKRRGAERNSWLALAVVLDAPEDLPERLAALDRALAIDPRCVKAHEIRAVSLSQAGRFEEAMSACRPAIFGERIPAVLLGRRAWIRYQAGQTEEAIREMRAVVREDPAFYWGWRSLAEWYSGEKNHAELLEATRMLVRLEPQDPVSWGFLGAAKIARRDKKGAAADFRHALDLAPDYGFAGRSLFDLQLEGNDLQGAAETLALLGKHDCSADVKAREAQLASRRNEAAQAGKALEELCVDSNADPWPLEAAMTAMLSAGWASRVEAVLEGALERPEVNPLAAELWVRRLFSQRREGQIAGRLRFLKGKGEAFRKTAMAYLSELVRRRKRWKAGRFIRRYRDDLRREVQLWGHCGYALLSLGRSRAAARWLSDWEKRQGVEPWMLLNLGLCLRCLHRHREAARVTAAALRLPPDNSTEWQRLWQAVDSISPWGKASTTDWKFSARPDQLTDYYRLLQALLQGVQEVHGAPPSRRRQAFEEARRRIAEAEKACPPGRWDRALKEAFRRSILALARRRGGLEAWLWWAVQVFKVI